MKNDFFAEIAAAGIQSGRQGLVEPQPPVLPDLVLECNDPEAVFSRTKKMDNAKELYEELGRQRDYYAPFLQDLAPSLPEYRRKHRMKEFQWRIGTEEDAANFAGVLAGEGVWEKVTIPHFGPPRGVAVTYYRTEFVLTEEELKDHSVWMVFAGVDYKAHVFMNGCYLGSHEGFFAPFEFEFSRCAAAGINTLVVMVENDYIPMGNCSEYRGPMYTGDKLYAATGPGYDEPLEGWHHCPPGMGIYQEAWVEVRSRIFLSDVFVRPLPEEECAELWLEVYQCDVGCRKISFSYSVYGQNFKETVAENQSYCPMTALHVGMGDTLTEAKVKGEGKYHAALPMLSERGMNYFRIPVKMKGFRYWEPDTLWLYQCQVRLLDEEGAVCDGGKRQFGMRSFSMDENSVPRGSFYLNGRQVRLRGANTMGHEQQCVMRGDWDQLRDDLLLAKICNMNFLRLTQRPVQPQVYDYCDRLGLMIQTDLPLFAALRRNQFAEAIRQAQEMEHLIRSHPCCILATYINEPMPNAHNKPHRNLVRQELEDFFCAADRAVRILNPDRVIKHIDGDYEPPTEGYPDNHCYCCWYNGHGIDIGKLHKGYWLNVKEGWHYGCGEFGIEALEDVSVMKKYYPAEWLPDEGREQEWDPASLPGAQTGGFHYFFYDTQHSLKDWVQASQRHQAESIALMTQAYRRDSRMNSFAYHLFIDAFPEGWMKTIMDVDRNPKQGFFAYRDALTPLMVNLRSDRRKIYAGERIPVEAWICNDREEGPADAVLHYQILHGQEIIGAGKVQARIPVCDSQFQGSLLFPEVAVEKRERFDIQLGLLDKDGRVLHDHSLEIEVFPERRRKAAGICILGEKNRQILETVSDMGWTEISLEEVGKMDVILALSYDCYQREENQILSKVSKGAKLLIQEWPAGEYEIDGSCVKIKNCGMLPVHFVSRAAGHGLVDGFLPDDFKFWYDPAAGYVTPLLERTIEAPDYSEVLCSGNQDSEGSWKRTGALVERKLGCGHIYLNEVKLFGRTGTNPIAAELLLRMTE